MLCFHNLLSFIFIPFSVFGFRPLLATKLRKYKNIFVIFDHILQGKMGKTEKKERKSRNQSDQNTKKPKDENMGWMYS